MSANTFFSQFRRSDAGAVLEFTKSGHGFDHYTTTIGPLEVNVVTQGSKIVRLDAGRRAIFNGQFKIVETASWRQTFPLNHFLHRLRMLDAIGIELGDDTISEQLMQALVLPTAFPAGNPNIPVQYMPQVNRSVVRPGLNAIEDIRMLGKALNDCGHGIPAPQGWTWFQITPAIMFGLTQMVGNMMLPFEKFLKSNMDLFIGLDEKHMPAVAITFPTAKARKNISGINPRGTVVSGFSNPGEKIWQTRALSVLLKYRMPELEIEDCLQAARLIETNGRTGQHT